MNAERLRTRIIEQHEEGCFLDDSGWVDGYSTTNLDGEVLGEWIDRNGTMQDNCWLEPQDGYIRLMIGDVFMLRLSGAEALRLQYNLEHLDADDVLVLPPASPDQIGGCWDGQWTIDGNNWHIAISDETKDEVVDILSWLTANHRYRSKR